MSEESKHKKPGERQQSRPPNLVPPDAGDIGESKPSRIMPLAIIGAGLLLGSSCLVGNLPAHGQRHPGHKKFY